MKTIDKIVLTLLALLVFAAHAYWPIGKMLGYNMPFESVLIGILGTLGAVVLGGIYLVWKN